MIKNITNKSFNLLKCAIFINYICVIYNVLIAKQYDYEKTVGWNIVGIVFAWLPIVILVLTCIVYSFIMISPKYIEDRRWMYCSIGSLFISVIFLFFPLDFANMVNIYFQSVFLFLLGINNFVFHWKLTANLQRKRFDISKEYIMMEKINALLEKEDKYKLIKIIDKLSYLFVIPFIIDANRIIFTILTLTTSIIVLFYILKLIRCYKKIHVFNGNKPTIILLNFCVSIVIGIILYCSTSFKVLSLLFLYSSLLYKSIFENKHAVYLYSQMDNLNVITLRENITHK